MTPRCNLQNNNNKLAQGARRRCARDMQGTYASHNSAGNLTAATKSPLHLSLDSWGNVSFLANNLFGIETKGTVRVLEPRNLATHLLMLCCLELGF